VSDPPTPYRFWRVQKWGRAVSYVLRQHAGTAVTFAGIAAALGGVLAAVGLVQISKEDRPAPIGNAWVVAGLLLTLAGTLFAFGVLIVLIVRRARDEANRRVLVGRQLLGSGYLRDVQQNKPIPGDRLKNWDTGNQNFLKKIDATYGFVARYLSDAGLPAVATKGVVVQQETFVDNRITRLNEFIAELER
jgi:hypothetical protein